jgi:hypothetical protein
MSNPGRKNLPMVHNESTRIHYQRALLATAVLEHPETRTHFDRAVQVVNSLSPEHFKRLRHTMLKLSNPLPEHTQILENVSCWLEDLNLQELPGVLPNAWNTVFIASSEGEAALEVVFSETPGPWLIAQIIGQPETYPPDPPRYEPEIQTRADFERLVKKYMLEIEAWYRKLGRDVASHIPGFRVHCRWFAHHVIALKSAEKIANSEDVAKQAVQAAIKSWANILQVKPPALRAGRPKK